MSRAATEHNTVPVINVTPLIDVLLVLLIIFMVAVPLRPHRFEAKVPTPPEKDRVLQPNDHTLVVSIALDRTLKLNGLTDMGTVADMEKLESKLADLFAERTRNHVFRDELRSRMDIPEDQRIEKTVFIKAPRAIPYGEVTRVIDGLKGAGAAPIGLQIDDLN